MCGAYSLQAFMRPIGSWVFGRIADRHGRKIDGHFNLSHGFEFFSICSPTYL